MTAEQILIILKKSSDFVSGELISEELKLSRTAVWKAINKLKSKGYMIESIPHRGYRLVSSADVLSKNELHPLCHTKMIGNHIVYFESCSSTNDEAKIGDLHGDEEGTVYITDLQTKGRGRMGRDWHNQEKAGVALSILLKPVISPSQILPVSLLAGLSVCKALEEVTGLPCQVKWPNDVIVNGKKIAGILIEMSTVGEMVQYIVLGIGVNCNNSSFPQEITSKATSILIETGMPFPRKQLVCKILENFENDYFKWVEELDESKSRSLNAIPPSYLNEYKSRCINIGHEVVVHQKDLTFNGIATDITLDGELLVTLPYGDERVVLSGEVSVRGIYGYV